MLIKSCGINASSHDTLAAVLQRFIFIAKDEWNKFDLQPQFFVDLPNWNPLSLSVFQHLSYCNFNNFWKSILRKNPSLLPPPIPFIFLYSLLKEMWMVNYNVCGYLWKLHVVSFFPQKQATFSVALTWLSSTAKGALQIYPSGGFRPVFSFVLGFLVLFFVVSILFYFFKFLSGSVVNHLLVLLLYVGHNNFKSRFC